MAQQVKNFTSLTGALVALYGSETRIAQTDRLAGGSINKAYGLHLTNGAHIFMKANAKENADFFTAESVGISAIRLTNTIGTSKILCTGTDAGEQVGYSFLLEEYAESKGKIESYWTTLAHELAAMHKADASSFVRGGIFGFTQDDFIGATPQINEPRRLWIDFFRDCRLVPQFNRASHCFDNAVKAKITMLLGNLEKYLAEPEKSSLLHGDLWSGNVLCGADGKAMLIDPAVYVGNREADIAMTQLFGGFPEEFYNAYNEAYPLDSGYEQRRDLYNLYHLLNHLNLFGETYLDPVCQIISEYTD